MIPPILHQTWKSKEDIPRRFAFWRQSFLENNPDLDVRLYDDADNRALLERTFPALLPLYDAFPREIFRVDFIRPVYLFTAGGYYADMDFQCLRPLAGTEAGADVVLGRMGTDSNYNQSIPNAFMASTPGQGFWLGYLAFIEKAWETMLDNPGIARRPEYVVGPVVLRRIVIQYLRDKAAFKQNVAAFVREKAPQLDPASIGFGKLLIHPAHVLYPISWKDRIHRLFLSDAVKRDILYSVEEGRHLFPQSLAVTYWTGSWIEGPRMDQPRAPQRAGLAAEQGADR